MVRRSELILAAAVLLLGAVAGWLVVAGAPAPPGEPITVPRMWPAVPPPGPLFLEIAVRNLTVLAVLLSGLVTWGVTTLSTLGFNGFRLGGLVASSLRLGMPRATLAALLLPHGIPELAAFVAAGAVGLRGWAIGRQALRTGRFHVDLGALRRPIGAAGVAVLGAAAVESTVTRHLLVLAMGAG